LFSLVEEQGRHRGNRNKEITRLAPMPSMGREAGEVLRQPQRKYKQRNDAARPLDQLVEGKERVEAGTEEI
jgi:hypothetical protein